MSGLDQTPMFKGSPDKDLLAPPAGLPILERDFLVGCRDPKFMLTEGSL